MKVFNFKELKSTQEKAKELAKDTQEPFLVLAETQAKGKGTKGRSWYSPFGGLYFTLAFELDCNLLEIDTVQFSQDACLGVVEVLKDTLQQEFPESNLLDLQVKPINDLYFRNSKLAGVLLESLNKERKSTLLVGIGLNVQKIDSDGIDREIISLEEILSKDDYLTYDRLRFSEKLAKRLLDRFKVMNEV